jgi:hypothetical protein
LVAREPNGPGGQQIKPGPAAISVVNPGFMVDLVDWGTPNQPHNPDRPRYLANQTDKRDKYDD